MEALGPQADVEAILAVLHANGSERNRAGMARVGIASATAFGVGHTLLRPMARAIGRDHDRAMALWATGRHEARLLAAMTADPARMTPAECRSWASGFASWDIVDGAAALFAATPFWQALVVEFAGDEREFVRRAAFAIVAWAAVHRKKEPDETFRTLLPLIEAHAGDDRNFVRKAVNWALRQIGKRSAALRAPALDLAETLAASGDRTERWIGRDAVRELSSAAVVDRLARKRPDGLH